MTIKAKIIHLLHIFLPLYMVAEVHANAQDVHDIINICTSSERIMKDYALVGMKITHHNPQKDLTETAKHLDTEMADLLTHKLTKKLHHEEEGLQHEWAQMEKSLESTPTKKEAQVLHQHVDTFAHHCEVLAEELAKNVGNPAELYVVRIARLNLDVQELAGLYVLKAWHAIEDDEYFPEVKATIDDYTQDYNSILAADDKLVSGKVKAKLKILKKHFMLFEVMATTKTSTFIPRLIAKKANMIHKETDSILSEEEQEVEK